MDDIEEDLTTLYHNVAVINTSIRQQGKKEVRGAKIQAKTIKLSRFI